ncbi:thioredoxin family protein [Shewanella donghaensis]|uniref:thioredoxin family protein n=1 Tax=Shewanella donghaensis TaxID=238836 RepID=UPI001182EAEA|nr:thioredoxin family protein [Shewanella donghaensis]
MKHLLIFTLLGSLLMTGCQSAHHADALPQYTFTPDANYPETVAATQEKALQQQKLLLVVLGAQWCHDSRGLAGKFSDPKMQTVLKQRFETVFIDVEYFEDRHAIAQQFGYPAYFGTPTVLVVDPKTSKLLNRETVPIWQSGDSVPLDEYIDYFSYVGKVAPLPVIDSEQLSDFTQAQVARLKQAFDYLRPVWKDVRGGTQKDSTELSIIATEVWKFRVQLQKNINIMNEQLRQNPQIELVIPSYEKFSWES